MDTNKLKQMASDAHDNAQAIGYDRDMYPRVFLQHMAGQLLMIDKELYELFSLAAMGGVENEH